MEALYTWKKLCIGKKNWKEQNCISFDAILIAWFIFQFELILSIYTHRSYSGRVYNRGTFPRVNYFVASNPPSLAHHWKIQSLDIGGRDDTLEDISFRFLRDIDIYIFLIYEKIAIEEDLYLGRYFCSCDTSININFPSSLFRRRRHQQPNYAKKRGRDNVSRLVEFHRHYRKSTGVDYDRTTTWSVTRVSFGSPTGKIRHVSTDTHTYHKYPLETIVIQLTFIWSIDSSFCFERSNCNDQANELGVQIYVKGVSLLLANERMKIKPITFGYEYFRRYWMSLIVARGL